MALVVQGWDGVEPPNEQELVESLKTEVLKPYRWSNHPGDVYNAHSHNYHKVIVVVKSSITFG